MGTRPPGEVPSALTSGGPLESLFLIAYLGWLLSELVGAGVVPRMRRGPSAETARADRGSRAAILTGIFTSIALAYAFVHLGWDDLPRAGVELGIALMFVGIGVRQWSIAVLGRFFSTAVRAVEGHRIVREGPYRLVRHPSYAGALLTMAGLGLASGSWEGLVAILGAAGLVFGYRIHVEERFLAGQFGAEYAAYRSTTKLLLPFVL